MEVYGLLASGYGDWPIIKQIAWLLGQVMNGIFNVLSRKNTKERKIRLQ